MSYVVSHYRILYFLYNYVFNYNVSYVVILYSANNICLKSCIYDITPSHGYSSAPIASIGYFVNIKNYFKIIILKKSI